MAAGRKNGCLSSKPQISNLIHDRKQELLLFHQLLFSPVRIVFYYLFMHNALLFELID